MDLLVLYSYSFKFICARVMVIGYMNLSTVYRTRPELCIRADNVDTPKVVASFRELMNESNVYMQSKRGVGAIPHGGLLRRIVLYMTRLLDVCLLLHNDMYCYYTVVQYTTVVH